METRHRLMRFFWNLGAVVIVCFGGMFYGKIKIDMSDSFSTGSARLLFLLFCMAVIAAGLVVSFEVAEVYVKRHPVKAWFFVLFEIAFVFLIFMIISVLPADFGIVFTDVQHPVHFLGLVQGLAVYVTAIVALRHPYD